MLQKVKHSLRILNTAFDDEVQDMIDAAIIDLSLGGITKLDQDNKIIIQAVTLYCKSHFGLENKDSAKYGQSYEWLKTRLSLSKEFNNAL
ncbi:DNA-packaging protein [Lysinibacillus sp. fkY74-1]